MLAVEILIAALLIARLSAGSGFRLGLVDHPDARKKHQGTVPLTGGVAVFITVLFGHLLLDIPPYSWEMLLLATVVFLVGLFDDIRHINPWVRLGIQYGAGVALATFGGIAIHNVGNLLGLGDIPLLLLTVPLTALAVAGLSNAYNMIDGIDGLAASLIALPLLVLFALSIHQWHPMSDTLLLMLIPLAVFLLFNLGPNNRLLPKMFLGDGGSVTLGFLVTASLVYFSQGENRLIQPVTALWLVTLPLMDMLATMLRRYRAGHQIMQADRLHLHHTLMELGLSPRRTLLLMFGYAACAAILGIALEAIPPYASLGIYFLLFCLHCLFVLKIKTWQGRR